MTEEDLNYVWADYKQGDYSRSFPELQSKDLNPLEFSKTFIQIVQSNDLDPIILFAENNGVVKPVGYLLLWNRGRIAIILQFHWFYYATSRNKMESAMNYLNTVRRTEHEATESKYRVIGIVDPESNKFFEHLSKYKVVRKVGVSLDYFGEKEHGFYYETLDG